MDPNANLREQREIVADVQRAIDTDSDVNGGDAVETLTRLAELVEALDEWLCKGGFLPDAWARGEATS